MTNRVEGIGGAYEADIIINGVSDTKTFFPDCWDHKKVVEKIYEAHGNAGNPVKIGHDGAKTYRGLTLEGIEFEIRLSADCKLLTAFPTF